MNIELKKIGKQFKTKDKLLSVIDEFTYNFNSGQLYSVKGASGKGKTTLLSIIGLLQNPDVGEIYFSNKIVSTLNNEQKCKLRAENIGYIFQDFNLLNGMTVFENIVLPNLLAKSVKKEIASKRAENIMKELGIFEKAKEYPFLLSGGEKQRVGIARMLMKNPQICICDEPVSNLDDENAKIIVDLLDKFAHVDGRLVITSNHNIWFDSIADYIIEL